MPGPKEKAAFGARRRIRASVLTGVGVSVLAPIWPCLRARFGLLQGRYYRPVADGAEVVGVQDRIGPASLFARSASLRAGWFSAEA